ncbi:MAG: MBL fold metallo-hydrolase [Candidatus Hydrogenedentes bacterium]|nr:MBL fold metallo-hydrolase [Candidatus Hydrogenedentota bacterium]
MNSPIVIDCHYYRPKRMASYLIADKGEAAFIDNNTAKALPYLLQALTDNHIAAEAVKYLIVTHIHLDHSGGTAALLAHCPNATVVVHPRGAPHLINPKRLVQSAKQVYGEALFEKLYGTIDPIDRDRVMSAEDGQALDLGSRKLSFLFTPGHAKHHLVVHDNALNAVFSGDAFGIGYERLQRGTEPYLLCSCPPTDFDAAATRDSIQRIVDTGAAKVFVAHYGEFDRVKAAAAIVIESTNRMEQVLGEALESELEGDGLEEFCRGRVRDELLAQLAVCGVTCDHHDGDVLDPDIFINARGLRYVVEKRRSHPNLQ